MIEPVQFIIILTHNSGNANYMKKSNLAVIEAMKVVLRQMDRLREGFRIEKEEALGKPGAESLEELRERARSFYRVRLAELSRELARLRQSISSDLPAREEAEDLAEICRRQSQELESHLISAPNRLLRSRNEDPATDEA
jgi:hypothetical protein